MGVIFLYFFGLGTCFGLKHAPFFPWWFYEVRGLIWSLRVERIIMSDVLFVCVLFWEVF